VQGIAVQREPAWYSVRADRADLVADRDVGVQIGVPGARVAVIERGRDQTGGVDLGDAVCAHAGKRRVLLQEGDGFGDRLVVAVVNLFGDVARGDGPQRRHRFDRGERQVVAGNGGGLRAGLAGNVSGEFPVIEGGAAVVFGEHVAGHAGAQLGLYGVVDLGVEGLAGGEIVVGVGGAQAAGEFAFVGVDAKRPPQTGRGDGADVSEPEPGQVLGDLIGVGVQPFSEQRLHLFFGDFRACRDAPQLGHHRAGRVSGGRGGKRRQPAAHPSAGGFALEE